MRAKLKINYAQYKKGEIYDFRIIGDGYFTINGVDFSSREVIPCEDNKTLWKVGEAISICTKFRGIIKTDKDFDEAVRTCFRGFTIKYKKSALYYYYYN